MIEKNQRSLAGEYFKPLQFISCWQLFLKRDFQMEETELLDNCEMSFAQCVVSRPPACIMKSVVRRRNYWDSSAVPVISDSLRWHSILITQALLLPSTYKWAVFRYSNSVLSMFEHSPHQTDRSVTTLSCHLFSVFKAKFSWASTDHCRIPCPLNVCKIIIYAVALQLKLNKCVLGWSD